MHIYTLDCPIDNTPKYIGVTNFPDIRLRQHISYARNHNTDKAKWINSVVSNGHKPLFNLIDEVSLDEWEFWEIYYIALFKSWGFNLLNKTKGGRGCVGHTMPESAKIKIGLYHKGRKWMLGKKLSAEHIEKIRRGNIGKDKTKGLQACWKARIGSKHSEATKKHWSEIRKGSISPSAKKIYQYDLEGVFIKEWDNIKLCSTTLKIVNRYIHDNLKGRRDSVSGFTFKYAT